MTKISNSGNYMWSQNISDNFRKSDISKFNSKNQTEKIIDSKKLSVALKDFVPKIVKEESIKNSDGTVTTITTNSWGITLHVTKRKDKNGSEYEERIQKRNDGTIQAKTINKNNTSRTKFYNENGKLEFESMKTYKKDGKTIETESYIYYDTSKISKVVKNERHRFENGDELEIHYDMPPKNNSYATVYTKENGKSVEKHYDLTGTDMIRGNTKLDKNGNIFSISGKKPRISSKIENPGLAIETRHYYSYNDDGTIEERIVNANGDEKFKTYDNEEDLKKGVTTLDKTIAKKIKNGEIQFSKTNTHNQTTQADKAKPAQNRKKTSSKPIHKTYSGYTPKVGAPSRYHKDFVILEVNEDGTFFEESTKDKSKMLLCNKNGEVIGAYKVHKNGYKKTTYSKGKTKFTSVYDKDGRNTRLRQHQEGITNTRIKTPKGEILQKAQYDDGRVRYFKFNPQTQLYNIECDKNGNPVKK